MANSVVSVQGLEKVFSLPKGKMVSALQGVSLEIGQGEFVALLGPNGAGKSTLIKILIGVLAYKGDVRVLGEEPLGGRMKIVSRLGVVFGQRSRLWWDLPVGDSFELTKRLYIAGYPSEQAEKLVKWERDLIEGVDIAALLGRQVKKLSLGERMRCELVNTLLYDPELIFLDEPTIGLDVVSKNKIRDFLKNLSGRGKTILLTSHDTGDIERLASRVIVINHGQIAVDLPVDQFMQLEATRRIVVKLEDKYQPKMVARLRRYKVSVEMISDYEVAIECDKQYFKNVLAAVMRDMPVEDVDFASESVERILVDLYNR